jgi:hypothetical protein
VGSGKNDDCEIWKENIFSNEEFYALIVEATILPTRWEAAKTDDCEIWKENILSNEEFYALIAEATILPTRWEAAKTDDCEIWKENILSNEEFYALIAEAMILPTQWEAAKMMIAKFGKFKAARMRERSRHKNVPFCETISKDQGMVCAYLSA